MKSTSERESEDDLQRDSRDNPRGDKVWRALTWLLAGYLVASFGLEAYKEWLRNPH